MAVNDYICSVPFQAIEIHDKKRFLCCASWLLKYLPESVPIDEAWNSDEANDVRDSILDGSYRYCDDTQCPFLSEAKKPTATGKLQPLYDKNNLPPEVARKVRAYKEGNLPGPDAVQFSFDRTCNLNCPSCRVKMFVADSKKIQEVQLTIDDIQDKYSHCIKVLYITGSGDPFISVGFRNFLRNFDPKKYPKLERIHLHTNATKWDKKMWDSMPQVHKFVKTCEISIDAGTKDTYENKTRINGNWDELMNNLKFINTIESLERIKTSFVVQNDNFREMQTFYDLMIKNFGVKAQVFFGKITNWGTFTEEEFKKHKIWDSNHPYHGEFLKTVNSVVLKRQVFHNLHEFIKFKESKNKLL